MALSILLKWERKGKDIKPLVNEISKLNESLCQMKPARKAEISAIISSLNSDNTSFAKENAEVAKQNI